MPDRFHLSELPFAALAPAIIDAATRVGLGADAVAADGAGVRRVWASEVAARLFGASVDQVLALDPDADVEPDLVARLLPRARGTAARPVEVCQADLLRTDRGRTPARVARVDFDFGAEPATVRALLPVGALLDMERELEASQRRFRALVDAAPDWILIVQDGRIVYANRAVVESAGYDASEDLIGTTFAGHVHPADLVGLAPRLGEGTEPPPSGEPVECRLQRADGAYTTIDVISMAIEWESRDAVLFIGRHVDPRREAQAELVQADRLSAIGTLAAGVAHEINNPLAYVLLNLQYLVRELPKLSREPARLEQLMERLGEAQHGVDRVRSIVRDLRDFSLPSQSGLGAVDLRRVLAAALAVSRPELEGRARIVESYRDVPLVCGDAARLEQVFLNLLVNAAHAFEQSQAQREVQLRLFQVDAERVGVEVEDNGVGIPADLIDRVFDPFFTTKPAGVGTGLGLPICHSIVSAHGGTISVTSQVGKGTSFLVVLPVFHAPPIVPSVLPPPLTPDEGRSPARVLVVDDELPVAAMVSRLLADEFDVRIATSGREALDILLRDPTFDVILCDVLMPGMTGMDLHRELAHKAPGYEQRLVFMTGGAFTARAAAFLEQVAQPQLEKPFDIAQVRKVVRRTARKKE